MAPGRIAPPGEPVDLVRRRLGRGRGRRSVGRHALVERADREERDHERQEAETFDHGRRDDHHDLKLVDRFGLARTALKFVPWELAHACIWQITFAAGQPSPLISAGFALVWVLVGANLVSLLVSRKHQTLYDWLSDTVVVGPV